MAKFSKSSRGKLILRTDLPLSSSPPYLRHIDYKLFYGEAATLMKARFCGISQRSLRELESVISPEALAIENWLQSELALALVVSANDDEPPDERPR